MGEQNLNIRIKHKYDTEDNWSKNDPVLLSGEIAITSDKSGKHKVGDGTHKWSELSYAKADLTKSDVTGVLGYTPPSSNTWRGIQDNLTSNSTTESLSAAQGKILKELVDGKAPSLHTHVKSEVGLGNVDNTADSAKSVKYATTAGSANAVAWANVSGKPAITGKQTRTLTASGPSGWTDAATDQGFVPDMAFMAYWNGAYSGGSSNLAYCNRGAFGTIVTKNAGDYATASHSHNYAGSGSAGGSANSAVKLDTATAGSTTQPVYFTGGKPIAIGYTIAKSVPANAVFTDHTYGNMKGASSSAAGSAGLVPAPATGQQGLYLRGDGTWATPSNTTYTVGTTSYSGTTKLYTGTGTATDGTMTQAAIKSALDGKANSSHTHSYAGASSAGGSANSANKLSTARSIGLSGDASGSVNFDGSGNVSIPATIRKYCFVGSDVENSAGWYKVASQTLSGYGDTNVIFVVTKIGRAHV